MSKKIDLRNRIAQVLAGILIATPMTSPVSSFEPLVGAGTPLPILQGATWAYFKGTVEPPAT